MKKSKEKRAISWLVAATMASSMCGFEASAAAPVGTQITGATKSTELLGEGTYYIADAEGLIKFSQLVNGGQVVSNTETPEAPTIGEEWNGGGLIYLPNP